MNLFAYGTLMDRRIIGRVIGRMAPPGVPATLQGYKKHETTLGYPIILPDSNSTVSGVVFYTLNAEDWRKLDIYENVHNNPPAYHRKLVTVQGTHGSISTQVYVGNLNFFRARLKR